MLEGFPDALGLPLDTAQMPGGGLDLLQLGASRRERGHRLLEVGVGHFTRVEFRAVLVLQLGFTIGSLFSGGITTAERISDLADALRHTGLPE